MTTLNLIRGGTTYSLTSGTYSYWMGDDGMGMAPLHRLTERDAKFDGDVDVGYRLDPRIVHLVLELESTTLNGLYTKRDQLIRLFGPSNTPLILQLVTSDTRQLDCFYQDGMSFPFSDRKGFGMRTAFTLRAADPTWYDPTVAAVTWTLSSSAVAGTVPRAIPRIVGVFTVGQAITESYVGTAPSYPHLIRITGPITDPVIQNTTTGEKLDFTGHSVPASDYYDIDCRPKKKTVKNSAGVNKRNELTIDSDLATFHLAPATDGTSALINSFYVSGTSVSAASGMSIAYYKRYLGK